MVWIFLTLWEKVEIGKILNFGNPPPPLNKRNIKTIKIPYQAL